MISYAGLALVLSQGFAGENRNLMLGALLVFGSALCYAVYLVSSSQVVTRIGSMRFTAYATSVASLLCILQFLLLRPLSALQLPPQVYGLAIAMALGCTVLPVFVTSEALRRIGANQVAIIGAAGPVTTIFLGWLGLEENMTLLQIAGAVLVLGGRDAGDNQTQEHETQGDRRWIWEFAARPHWCAHRARAWDAAAPSRSRARA